jgi:hypothetical protein
MIGRACCPPTKTKRKEDFIMSIVTYCVYREMRDLCPILLCDMPDEAPKEYVPDLQTHSNPLWVIDSLEEDYDIAAIDYLGVSQYPTQDWKDAQADYAEALLAAAYYDQADKVWPDFMAAIEEFKANAALVLKMYGAQSCFKYCALNFICARDLRDAEAVNINGRDFYLWGVGQSRGEMALAHKMGYGLWLELGFVIGSAKNGSAS